MFLVIVLVTDIIIKRKRDFADGFKLTYPHVLEPRRIFRLKSSQIYSFLKRVQQWNWKCYNILEVHVKWIKDFSHVLLSCLSHRKRQPLLILCGFSLQSKIRKGVSKHVYNSLTNASHLPAVDQRIKGWIEVHKCEDIVRNLKWHSS